MSNHQNDTDDEDASTITLDLDNYTQMTENGEIANCNLSKDKFSEMADKLLYCEKLFKNLCVPNPCKNIHIQENLFSKNTLQMIKAKKNLCLKVNCNHPPEYKQKSHLPANCKEKILTNVYHQFNLAHQFFYYNPDLNYCAMDPDKKKIKYVIYKQQNQEIDRSVNNGTIIKMMNKTDSKITIVKQESKLSHFTKLTTTGNLSIRESHVWTEIRLLSYLKKNNCKYVVQLQGVALDQKKICMILEAGQQSLQQVICDRKLENKPFTETEIMNIFMNILYGLEYIHEHWYHLDIKPDNIVKGAGEIWKIIDFQSATEKSKSINCNIGTPCYRAPQQEQYFRNIETEKDNCVANNKKFDDLKVQYKFSGKQDIYSFGVTMFQVLTLSKQCIIKQFTSKHKENKSKNILDMIAIVEEMLKTDPNQRPTLKDLKKKPIIVQDILNSYINNHLVFCLDSSGSMSGKPWESVVKAFQKFRNNRGNRAFDRVSVILFTDKPHLKYQMKKWDEINNIKETFKQCIGGGTDFSKALNESYEVLKRNYNFVAKSSIIFMSDGICDTGIKQAQTIYHQFKDVLKKPIKAAFLACGKDVQQSNLQQLSDQFKVDGTYYTCESNQQIILYFEHLSKLMA